MAKQIATMNDFSGGLNDSTDKRDLAPNEFAECTNLDQHKKGKLITSPKFKPDAITDNGSVVDGYGMFVFSNDYQVSDNAAGYTGYYIANADGSGNIDIFQSGNGNWYSNKLTSTATGTPAFMSAEGDLFVSGDHSATPASFVYKKRTDFNLATGSDSNIDRDVAAWSAENQAKAPPTAADMRLWWASVDDNGVSGGGSNVTLNAATMAYTDPADAIATDEINWVIEWGGATTGTWSNTGDKADRYIQFAATWLYKNLAESDMYEFTTPAYVGAALDQADGNYQDATDRALKVHACMHAVSETDHYGARLYARMSDEQEFYLLAEVDFEKGIIGDTETEFTAWANTIFSCNIGASTGFIEQAPAVYSFFALNGYSPSDIPKIGTSANRKVFWKTGVIANSRAYVGNVMINDRVYGDRIFKSPAYQYDVFTESMWIENTTNDGDQITALATYADRILMFKEQSVTVINVSQVEEYVESEQKEAGVTWPAAVAQTQFGIAWANETGCFMYNGESISNLLYTKSEGGQTQKIDDVTWTGSIVKPVVGFAPKTRQLIVIWNAASATNAFMYSFDTQSWSKISDVLTGDVSNMVNIRGGDLYIQGGTANGDINKLTTRADASSNPTVTLETGELSFGNYESKKNLNKVIFTYQGGSSTSLAITGATNGGSYGATLGTLSGGSGRQTLTLDLTGNSDYQGKKTFQIKMTGVANAAFELEDISLIFRDLGAR